MPFGSGGDGVGSRISGRSKPTHLAVSWTTPFNGGSVPSLNYDVQYKKQHGHDSWTRGLIRGLTGTITGLEHGRYHI